MKFPARILLSQDKKFMKRTKDALKQFKTKRRLATIFILVIVIVLGYNRFYNYVSNYYEATDNAWTYINEPADGVTVEYVDNTIVFSPDTGATTGFIFYPGGLVETEAYAPLMEKLAENGIECILVEMPYYLAIFDANGANGIQDEYPEIDNWYIGGHSLGGAMAGLYAERHSNEYDGIVLLAAYSTKDLTDSDLDVLLIRGSEDGVLNMDKYNENLVNLPVDYTEVIIDGGCHSYFGDYGIQAGDGTPTITVEEQTEDTVEAILEFILFGESDILSKPLHTA